jgi:single-strand DNA-binding protein
VANGFQSYVLIGNLTNDPEMTYVNETAKTRFSVACNTKRGNKERVLFVDVECWAKTAEFVAENFRKGRSVVIHGAWQEDKWEDSEGIKHKKLYVNADQVNFNGPRPADEDEDERPARRQQPERSSKEYDGLPF